MLVCICDVRGCTDAWRIRPVLENSLFFLLVILLLLTLSRQELLCSASLGEGGGHELTDVSSFRLHQLLCRSYVRRDQAESSIPRHYTFEMITARSSYGCHRAAPQPKQDLCTAVRDSGSSFPQSHGDVCRPGNHTKDSVGCVALVSGSFPEAVRLLNTSGPL